MHARMTRFRFCLHAAPLHACRHMHARLTRFRFCSHAAPLHAPPSFFHGFKRAYRLCTRCADNTSSSLACVTCISCLTIESSLLIAHSDCTYPFLFRRNLIRACRSSCYARALVLDGQLSRVCVTLHCLQRILSHQLTFT
jgi:hypothetical protein